MSDTDPDTLTSFEKLDLAEASSTELAHFAQRHGVAVEKLEQCQHYLKSASPIRGHFELHALTRVAEPVATSTLVLRLRRDDSTWVELPSEFPSKHILALIELLHALEST